MQLYEKLMREVTLKTIEQNDTIAMYSICFEQNNQSEFEKFLSMFKEIGEYKHDFDIILLALKKIMSDGAKERFFRIEGTRKDRVGALAIDSRKLRLYCLRISDQVIILGNGGVKRTRTYQEDEKLSGYVLDLQQFDKALIAAQKNGHISIERNIITNIENETFEL